MIFKNGANIPLNQNSGTLPDVSGSFSNYFQPMVFEYIKKSVSGFQAVEVSTPINFQGMIQILTERQLQLKPEGQRAWSWYQLHAETALNLEVDSVVVWNGKQTRVMAKKDYSPYGYVEYSLVQDWTGAGPK